MKKNYLRRLYSPKHHGSNLVSINFKSSQYFKECIGLYLDGTRLAYLNGRDISHVSRFDDIMTQRWNLMQTPVIVVILGAGGTFCVRIWKCWAFT